MMSRLLVLMYHRVTQNEAPNDITLFEKHLLLIKDRYPIVLPSEELNPHKINLCLTFDDAYYDFYKYVFPLLVKHKIKAILAVPTFYILPSAKHVPPKTRLSIPYPCGMNDDVYLSHAPFCSFEEIKEMSDSGFVEIASHSHKHPNLCELTPLQIEDELITSKKVLEAICQKPIRHFIYPYGKQNKTVRQLVKLHYEYDFKISSAMNLGWKSKNKLLYRVNAEPLWRESRLWTRLEWQLYRCKYWINFFKVQSV